MTRKGTAVIKLKGREIQRTPAVCSTSENSAQPLSTAMRGRPKEDRELKKRISLAVLPSLYGDIQKIAYVERRSVSELVSSIMTQYRDSHRNELSEYERLTGEK